MRVLFQRRWLVGAAALVLTVAGFAIGFERWNVALAKDKSEAPVGAGTHSVSFLRDVRPILAQHCFQCHGPDEAARKGKLRLDLKDKAFAERAGKHVIAPGDLDGSLAWERITSDDDDERMPPEGKAEPLSAKQIATLKTWIKEGARWEDHWSFQPPRKPSCPKVADQKWVRDPLDAFVLARLDRDHLKPEPEASREAWLRRASFDLTGLPPTTMEIDQFLADKRTDAYEAQVDRLFKSQRYGERQAEDWLDLARYADTSGYQGDVPREIWKWREWVINAFNANMPFDQFTIEQLAGDLLPNATLAQKVATGFNRNHPTNSEAGEEEDEYRSAYVVDRVNTTATVFMGVTLACAQCHDHKYDPLTQRDYYSFYAYFNNIKERDSEYMNPRPSIPVPSADQEPRLADLKARIDALKKRLERDDSLTDAAQKEWERDTLKRLGKPIGWTTPPLSGMLSRGGSQLKLLDDGSILSTGPAPVKDTYDIMLLPGKKRITALRLEVLPDDSMPEKGLGRASDGRFVLSAIEIRNTTFSESSEPPLVYVSRAEADINQKRKEEPTVNDMMPGPIESAVVIEPVGSGQSEGRMFGGWSIVDDERKKPHEAIFLPLEPLDTNEASVIRISLHHTPTFKFKTLIGRFRLSYTQDDRIRELMLSAQPKLWSSIGPFPAQDVAKAYATAFELEKDIKSEPLDLKKSYTKPVVEPAAQGNADKPAAGGAQPKPAEEKAAPKKQEPAPEKPAARQAAGKAETPPARAKSETKTPAKKSADDAGKKPAGTGGGDAAKPEKAAKPGADTAKDGKPKSRAPAQKPRSEATKAAKPDTKADTAMAETKEPPKAVPPKPKPEKISWTEQLKWRDGTPARLQGANAAHYLTRKIVSTRPRTAMVQIDGPDGFRMWVNGELAQTALPPPATPTPPKATPDKPPGAANDEDAKSDAKADDDKEEPVVAEINDANPEGLAARGRESRERKFRIGLRAGENEIVLKVAYDGGARPADRRALPPGANPPGGGMGPAPPGGGSFMFNITPEGDDVLTHEVAMALRTEATERVKGACAGAIATVPASDLALSRKTIKAEAGKAHGTSKVSEDAKTPPKQDAPPNASKVGEKSAPTKPPEDENKLTPGERRQKVLREYYRSHIDSIGRIVAEELSRFKDEEKLVKRRLPQTLVMEELDKPRQAYIFQRGLYKNRGENVGPATPAVLLPLPKGAPRNRLGLAKWLVSKDHPLTARVLVNRIWKQYFGTGLVRTAEDFGTRGELPTHPELLDYLATELIDSKWDMKKLHQRIVLSATYRQASTAPKAKLERDPENRLLARGPRLRLTAEMIRDNALAVSGLLVEKVGGPSVMPRQPRNAWKTVDGFMPDTYRRHADERQYRRALYVYWKRGAPFPSMVNFDAVKRDSCTVTRTSTTTPVQALTLLNDPVYVECAKMLGQRMIKDREAIRRARDLKKPEEDAKRLVYGFRLCTSRLPTEPELQLLRKLLDDERAQFKADVVSAKKLIGVGDAKVDENLDPAEVAAWTCVGSALINLDATIHR
jgi:hypothetical protein